VDALGGTKINTKAISEDKLMIENYIINVGKGFCG
jgi:hypothetical protein